GGAAPGPAIRPRREPRERAGGERAPEEENARERREDEPRLSAVAGGEDAPRRALAPDRRERRARGERHPARHADQPFCGRDVADPTPARPDESVARRDHERERAVQVHGERGLEVRARLALDRRDADRPGAVREEVEPPERLDHALDRLTALRGVADVARPGGDPSGRAASELALGRRERLPPPRHDRDREAAREERARQLPAEAARAAGHERDALDPTGRR